MTQQKPQNSENASSPPEAPKKSSLELKVEKTSASRDDITRNLTSDLIASTRTVDKLVADACKFAGITPPKPQEPLAPFVYKLQKQVCRFNIVDNRNGCDGMLGPITLAALIKAIPKLKVYSKEARTAQFKQKRRQLARKAGLPKPPEKKRKPEKLSQNEAVKRDNALSKLLLAKNKTLHERNRRGEKTPGECEGYVITVSGMVVSKLTGEKFKWQELRDYALFEDATERFRGKQIGDLTSEDFAVAGEPKTSGRIPIGAAIFMDIEKPELKEFMKPENKRKIAPCYAGKRHWIIYAGMRNGEPLFIDNRKKGGGEATLAQLGHWKNRKIYNIHNPYVAIDSRFRAGADGNLKLSEPAEVVSEAKETAITPAKTAILGDSLSKQYAKYFYKGTNKYRESVNKNFGVGWNIQKIRRHAEKNLPMAEAYVINGGINAITGFSVDRMTKEYEKIIALIKAKNPNVKKIVLLTVHGENYKYYKNQRSQVNSKIRGLNDRLRALAAADPKIKLVDINAKIKQAEAEGHRMTSRSDNLHFNARGQKAVAGLIKDELQSGEQGVLTDYA